MFLLVAALALFGPPAQLDAPPALHRIDAELVNGAVVLTFTTSEASVPSPVKLLESPLRLYFDVAGFRPGSRRTWDVNLGPVRQIRTALNQPRPAVLRVVVDLTERPSWRVEPGASPREFRLVIADAPPASGPSAMTASPAAPAPSAAPVSSSPVPLVSALNALTPVLESIRAGDGPSDAALTVLLARAETLAGAARSLDAGAENGPLLQVAADAVLSASRARAAAVASGDAQSRANAVSAAAGALLLIDRLR